MLEFLPLELDNLKILSPWLLNNPNRLCDGTIGGEYLWRGYYQIFYVVVDGSLIFRAYYPEGNFTAFSYPIGGNPAAAVRHIREYTIAQKVPLIFCPVSVEDKEILLQVFPGAVAEAQRNWFDYLYSAQSLCQLPGHHFAGQRNHIHQFEKAYPNWRFEKLTAENLPKVRAFFVDFVANTEKQFPAAAEESAKTLEVMDNFALYGFVGGAIFVEDAVVAFALGEQVGDTLYVHIEKADREYQGAYPMIVQQFSQAYTNEKVQWINREDDVGDDGLRKVKLSYQPVRLLEKYKITVAEDGEYCPLSTNA